MTLTDELENAEAALAETTLSRVTHHATAMLFVKIFGVVVASAIAGFAQFSALPPDGMVPSANALGMSATVIVCIAGIYLTIADQGAVKDVENAAKAMSAARFLHGQYEALMSVLKQGKQVSHLYSAIQEMRNLISKSLPHSEIDEEHVINSLLDETKSSLQLAFDFSVSDFWTINVYKAEARECFPASLKCIAHLRQVSCLLAKARVWKEGEGIAGVAYARGEEVIVPDLAAADLGTLHHVSAQKAQDLVRYRSIVAVPVKVGTNAEKWGLVVASSSRANHFSPQHDGGIKTSEAARGLAGMIALFLTARSQLHARNSDAQKANASDVGRQELTENSETESASSASPTHNDESATLTPQTEPANSQSSTGPPGS